jgi:hypothetical protein
MTAMLRYAVAIPLLALLGASVWWAIVLWSSVEGPPMPAIGYVAMGFGVFFSLLVGCGLMALVFYSARHGYDEGAHRHDSADER